MHPLCASQKIKMHLSSKTIPDFIGPSLPRSCSGDREYYCLTMLTLFKPWRSGSHLKEPLETWDDAYSRYQFCEQHLNIIKYFNIKHECHDAADDYSAQMK
ncbi:hypothetical protein BDN72DRAFT_771306, partial [Pluteus cervinus]